MKYILVNYNFTPEWVKNEDYLIYDRSDSDEYLKDFDKQRIIKTENIGNVDYDKLSFLIDNYASLPDVFIWGKTNLFKYITPEEFDKVKNNRKFTPLLTQKHKTYGEVCKYKKGMYYEINNSWYLNTVPAKYFDSWADWADTFHLPKPDYIPFAPGGNYILTRDIVHKYPKRFYRDMRAVMGYTQLPGEAQLAERSYYLMWS